mmetsp:Transcript_6820/g.12202  ORF Transcript_6820/g.12202 Transcript_6820/m.12202 type:complete len:209 (+) Transcript_6820:772-1398(+)
MQHILAPSNKTRHLRQVALHHKIYQKEKLIAFLAYFIVSLTAKLPENLKVAALLSSHQLNHFVCELEWCLFKFTIPSRRIRQQKPKINVDNVSVRIKKDVAIVSIFQLQHVGNNGVSRHRFHKIAHSSFVARCVRGTVFAQKIIFQCGEPWGILLDRVDGIRIYNSFNEAGIRRHSCYFVRIQPNWNPCPREHIIMKFDQTRSKHFLP